ncbi:Fosmidomycin resistance protein [Planctomycetes bacterium Pan216]|uniref:Fosmidomycin resistance protein n=1 Tax=Kolteria novifilia TaxID=2527975 RepID=A0A518B571_9BACT|nr:Fosmidomycin resistance protein [Planctomycetes bacterium Pan216]
MPIVCLTLLVVCHVLVDMFAVFPQPLWPTLAGRLSLNDESIQIVYAAWMLSTSLAQVAFGIWSDRFRGSWLIWGGPIVGVICLSLLGTTSSPLVFTLLVVVGGLGIAAFHPESAALAGACMPENRRRAMSIYTTAGFVGTTLGPLYSGWMTTEIGMAALSWSILWALPVVGVVAFGLWRSMPTPSAQVTRAIATPQCVDRPRTRRLLTLLLTSSVFRVLAISGTMIGLAYMINRRGGSATEIGLAQAVYIGASGVGMLGAGFLIGPRTERSAVLLLPLLSVPALMLCPYASPTLMLCLLALAGSTTGAATPIMISLGQRLLPFGQRVASAITMGGAWGIAGTITAIGMAVFNELGAPELAFTYFPLGTLLASLICLWIPMSIEEPTPCRGNVQVPAVG